MSPAITLSALICSLPFRKNRLDTFNSLPFVTSYILSSLATDPDKTLNIETLPTNGSARVLKTTAENGASSFDSKAS